MHDFVVAQDKNKVFMESVDHRKGRFPLVEPAVDWLAAHIEQKVVHPVHIPFKAEPEAAEIGRTRNTRPGGGFLCDGHDPWKPRIAHFVKALDELNRLQIFASAMDVWHPFAWLARVVQVEHRRHRVDPKTVDVEFVEPVKAVRDKKIAHFVSAVIEDQRTPITVLTLAGISMLVKVCSVE